MPISREEFLAKRVSRTPETFVLPDGDEVLLLPVSVGLYRKYKRSLRDKDGVMIPERQEHGDELLAARILVDEAGNRWFSDEDIMDGSLDELHQNILSPIIVRSYEMTGLTEETDEVREKNSLATDSIEQLSE